MQSRFDEGVYIYQGGTPRRGSAPRDKPLLIYFDNRKCMFCRRFDPRWEELVQRLGEQGGPLPVRVVCTFFAEDCGDDEARGLFREFGVTVTPLLVFWSPSGVVRRIGPQRLWELEPGDLALVIRGLSSMGEGNTNI